MSGRQKIFNLPYPRMANKGLNQQMLVFLDRNLLEIERQLSLAQGYQEETVKEVIDSSGNLIADKLDDKIVGLEHALQIANQAITTAKIALKAVTEALLADGAVTNLKLAAGAVTEAKTNWQTHLLSDYGIADNTPMVGFISWSGVKIVYKGVEYEVMDGSTDKLYVWWDFDYPTIMQTAQTLPTMTDDDVLVFLNKNGTHLVVPKATVVDGSLLVSESVLTDALAANAVTALKIAAGAIKTVHLAAGSVVAECIASGAVTAEKINVETLAAISANLGVVNAGYIQVGEQLRDITDIADWAQIHYGPKQPTVIEHLDYDSDYFLMGGNEKAAQSFKPIDKVIGAKKIKVTIIGTQKLVLEDGSVEVHIYDDNDGLPGSSISTTGFASILWEDWPDSPAEITCVITLDEELQADSQYWIVLEQKGYGESNYVKFAVTTENLYTDGMYASGGFSWMLQAQTDMAFKVEAPFYEEAPFYDQKIGDILIDPTDNNRRFRWNGTEWEDAEDTNYKDFVTGQIDEVNTSIEDLDTTITDAFSDSKLTNIEANSLSLAFNNLSKEATDVIVIGNGLGIDTTACSNALTALTNEMASWLGPEITYPVDITAQDRVDIAAKFETLESAIVELNKAIQYGGQIQNDSNVTAYFPFDDSLYDSKNLVQCTFNRDSVAYLPNGTQVGTDIARYDTARIVRGVLIEEGTTNLLTENESSVETDLIGLSSEVINGTGTFTRDTTKKKYGNASAKLTCSSPGEWMDIYVDKSITGGLAYTFSVNFLASVVSGTRSVRVFVGWYNGSTFLSRTDTAGVTVSPSMSDFIRLSVSDVAPANASRGIFVLILGDPQVGDVLYWDGAQLEQKPYPTSWTLGGTTRVPETLTIPTAGIFQKGNWAVDVTYIPNNSDKSLYKLIWMIRIDGTNLYQLCIDQDTGLPTGRVQSDSVYYTIQGSEPVIPGNKYVLTFSGDGATLSFYCNGDLVGSIPYTEPVGDLPSEMQIGTASYGASLSANGIIDELRFSKVARTLAEHQAYYNSQKGYIDREPIVRMGLPVNGFMITPDGGAKCYHSDGSFSQMAWNGFRRYNAGEGKDYHYLTEIGRASTVGYKQKAYDYDPPDNVKFTGEEEYLIYVPPITIQLPDDFKGKKFEVFAELRMNGRNLFIYFERVVLSTAIGIPRNVQWVCEAYDYDYINATFKIKAYSYLYALEGNLSSRWYEIVDGVDIAYTVIA
jgi:hypothetical protein